MEFPIDLEAHVVKDLELCPEDFEFYVTKGRVMANVYGVHTPVEISALPKEYSYLFSNLIANVKSWKVTEKNTLVLKF